MHAHPRRPPARPSSPGLPSSSLSAVRRFSMTSSCPARMDDAPAAGTSFQGCGGADDALMAALGKAAADSIMAVSTEYGGLQVPSRAHPARDR